MWIHVGIHGQFLIYPVCQGLNLNLHSQIRCLYNISTHFTITLRPDQGIRGQKREKLFQNSTTVTNFEDRYGSFACLFRAVQQFIHMFEAHGIIESENLLLGRLADGFSFQCPSYV